MEEILRDHEEELRRLREDCETKVQNLTDKYETEIQKEKDDFTGQIGIIINLFSQFLRSPTTTHKIGQRCP